MSDQQLEAQDADATDKYRATALAFADPLATPRKRIIYRHLDNLGVWDLASKVRIRIEREQDEQVQRSAAKERGWRWLDIALACCRSVAELQKLLDIVFEVGADADPSDATLIWRQEIGAEQKRETDAMADAEAAKSVEIADDPVTEPASEPDGYLPPSFSDKERERFRQIDEDVAADRLHRDPLEDIRWVSEHIDDEEVTALDAPSRAAWSFLHYTRHNPERFYSATWPNAAKELAKRNTGQPVGQISERDKATNWEVRRMIEKAVEAQTKESSRGKWVDGQ